MELVTGYHARTSRAQRKRAAGPGVRPKDGLSGKGECPTPDIPRRGTRRPPRVLSRRPHIARRQHPTCVWLW